MGGGGVQSSEQVKELARPGLDDTVQARKGKLSLTGLPKPMDTDEEVRNRTLIEDLEE